MGKLQGANVIGGFLRTWDMLITPWPRVINERTDQPISTANYALSINHVVAESEHIEFPFLDDNEHVHPSLAPRSLARGFIILFTAQHPLLCPWRTEEREFFICDTNGRIR